MAKKQTAQSCTTDEIAQIWLADIRVSVKESTYARYYRLVHKYILPRLGSMHLKDIDSLCLNRFTEELLKSGGLRKQKLAPKTVTDVLCVVKSILKFARLQGYSCPGVDGMRLPPKTPRNIRVLSGENRQMLENLLLNKDDTVSLGILLSLFTGLRIGEVCGLQWGDIDQQAQLLFVRRTVGRIADLDPDSVKRTKVIVSEPKTTSSYRIIPLPKFLGEVLQDNIHDPQTFILSGTRQPMEPHCFYTRYQRLMAANKLSGYSFHALRHTFATRCVEVGFDTKSLSEILGHSNISTTLAFYVHPSMEQKRQQMEKLTPV